MATTLERAAGQGGIADARLRRTGVACLAAVAVHGIDHLRRGTDVVTTQVLSLGTVQLALVVIAVVLVFRRHPWAAPAAIAVGLPGAIGFAAVHLLPHWGSFSDPFTGVVVAPKVNALSWVTALLEIGADLAFGWAGIRAFNIDGGHGR
jgi:hypothetical protein